MEIFELRYFIGVARDQNIHRASEKMGISPGSLSKAISRLEDELGVSLFSREGRNIQLTDQGRLLEKKASEILQLEEATRVQVAGQKGTVNCVVVGPEILLIETGLKILSSLEQKLPNTFFELRSCDDAEALNQVEIGQAHLAIVTLSPPKGLTSKRVGSSVFKTCVGNGHKLYSAAKAAKTIAVEEVLQHRFVSPSFGFLGQVRPRQSLDGWRDDQFPRKVSYVASSIKTIESLVKSGRALAYLPDYFVDEIGATSLKISGCPYVCQQSIFMVARNPKNLGWLNQLF